MKLSKKQLTKQQSILLQSCMVFQVQSLLFYIVSLHLHRLHLVQSWDPFPFFTFLSLINTMKWEVKLYVGGKVFTEEVHAANHQDAKSNSNCP